MRPWHRHLLLLAIATLAASSLGAQAVVRGRVVADSTRLPLALADVLIEELDRITTTSDSGTFRLADIPLGVYSLRIRRVGFRSAVATLRIEAPDSVMVELPMVSWIPQLEPVLVRARQRYSREAEIAERHRIGGGRLIPFDRLREREHLGLADVLAETGVRIAYDSFRRAYALSPRVRRLTPGGGSGCPMQIFLDGVLVQEDLSQVAVAGLGAVEVFRSGTEAPIQYSGLGRQCGVVLLWTRER
ncbi:MAG: carboxypeptidase regulatory-like domain-containing protein [Gemmatimonadales bacterium]